MSVYQKKAVGKRIRELRMEKGWTRGKLAEQLEISDRYSSSIELGQKGMSIETLLRLASSLDVTTDYILTGIDMQRECPKTYHNAVYWLERCPMEKLPYLEEIVLAYLFSLDKNPASCTGRKKLPENMRLPKRRNEWQ